MINQTNYIKDFIEVLNKIDYKIVIQISNILINSFNNGGKVIACGNGGSYSDADHFIGEIQGRYKKNNAKPLPGILLNPGGASGSAISNDYAYEECFARLLNPLLNEKDVLICLSTSGKSKNILNVLEVAKSKDSNVIFFTSQRCNLNYKHEKLLYFKVPSDDTPLIQQTHMCILHMICEELEKYR